MKFGPVPLDAAAGAILAHSVKVASGRLRKGVVLHAAELAELAEAGLSEVTVARLEPGDVEENAAAARLARAIVSDEAAAGLRISTAFTGRVNLVADGPGLVELDVGAIHALNAVDPMITCATVLPMTRLEEGGLAATIKIISYAVSEVDLERACAAASGAMRLRRPVVKRVDLIVTDTGAGPDDAKGIAAIEMRLARLGVAMNPAVHVPHRLGAICEAMTNSCADLILVLTGSATSDVLDTAPSALTDAGGEMVRFGMPVDPGNLLFLGKLDGVPVIGLPGCARSPALNGADWVLERVICGVDVSGGDIAAMGVGGLLKEIPQRPQPRRGGLT